MQKNYVRRYFMSDFIENYCEFILQCRNTALMEVERCHIYKQQKEQVDLIRKKLDDSMTSDQITLFNEYIEEILALDGLRLSYCYLYGMRDILKIRGDFDKMCSEWEEIVKFFIK